MKKEDELRSYEFYGDDYTIKIWEREDCRFYSTVLYETDDDAKIVYTSKAQPDMEKARNLAIENARRHEQKIKEEA